MQRSSYIVKFISLFLYTQCFLYPVLKKSFLTWSHEVTFLYHLEAVFTVLIQVCTLPGNYFCMCLRSNLNFFYMDIQLSQHHLGKSNKKIRNLSYCSAMSSFYNSCPYMHALSLDLYPVNISLSILALILLPSLFIELNVNSEYYKASLSTLFFLKPSQSYFFAFQNHPVSVPISPAPKEKKKPIKPPAKPQNLLGF